MHITFIAINKFLIDEDVEGYIEAGAPTDEYSDEAAHIAEALPGLKDAQVTNELVLSIICLLWSKKFELTRDDMELRIPALNRIANHIINRK